MTENLKRFRIEFTVDVHQEGLTKDWDWNNDDIKDSALQELKCMSPAPVDITFSEVGNPWHTGTPTEEGWYLLKCSYLECSDYIYETKYFTFYSELSENVIEWQKIEENEDGKE